MGQALYRRYRSKNLAEIVGQDHITQTLNNALKRGAVSHAYLLTGPKGVGKTSIARILAHEINQLPYESEQVHLDIIEIDAASNRRIDEIRDLRDKVHIAPSNAQYKVYIIDEVHMLTKEAFNALLKTLEEPPKHVIFILATTDVHKLPETIISRTQHFTFKPIPVPKIVEHLKTIAKQEKIKINDEALELIAEHGNGSFRDSIGLLEQATGLAENVSSDDVRRMLGVPPASLIADLLEAFTAGDPKACIELLQSMRAQGYLAEEIARHLGSVLRKQVVNVPNSQSNSLLMELARSLIDVPSSPEPATLLEIILLERIQPRTQEQTYDESLDTKKREVPEKTLEVAVTTKTAPKMEDKDREKVPKKKQTSDTVSSVAADAWQSTLVELKKSYSTLYSIVRMAEFSSEDGSVTLTFKFPFHKKRAETNKHKSILHDMLHSVTGDNHEIFFELANKKPQKEVEETTKSEEKPPLEAISNIFGGGEVLES